MADDTEDLSLAPTPEEPFTAPRTAPQLLDPLGINQRQGATVESVEQPDANDPRGASQTQGVTVDPRGRDQIPSNAYSRDPDGEINRGSTDNSIPGDVSPLDDPNAGSREQSLGAQIDRSQQTEIITDPETGLITIRNTTGSTVTISANGDITICSTRAVCVNSASDMSFSADGNMSFDCNQFSLQARGNTLFNIEGTYTLGVTGDKQEFITNTSTQSVFGDQAITVRGSSTNVVAGSAASIILGSSTQMIRGDNSIQSQGAATFTSGGTLKMTSEGNMYITSPNLNAAAGNISIFGATGFIGGDGVVHRGRAMYATTFHGDLLGNVEGDLNGTADHAINAATTALLTGSYTGDAVVDDIVEDRTGANISIDADNIDAYLNLGPGGIVDLDIDDEIINILDPSLFTDGILSRFPTMEEIRLMLRDSLNRLNPALINWLIERGLLSPTFRNACPRGIGGIGGPITTPRRGSPGSGPGGSARGDGFGGPPGGGGINTNPNRNEDKYEPNPAYDPNNIGTEQGQPGEPGRITQNTLVGEGVPLSSFLRHGARLETLTPPEQFQFAKYAHIHTTYFYNKYKGDPTLNGGRLQILSGLYTPPGPGAPMTPGGINDLAQTGRVAVYEVLGTDGKQDLDATFTLAVKMSNSEIFEKIILDYDTYESPDTPDTPENPFFSQRKGTELEDGTIVNTKIVVILPEFDEQYFFGRAAFEAQTLLNGEVQGEYLFNLLAGTGRLNHQLDAALLPALAQILIDVGDELNMRCVTTSGITGRQLTESSGYTRDQAGSTSGRHNGFVPPAIRPWNPRQAQRHTLGHASDTALYYPGNDGRRLSVRSSSDRPLVERFRQRFIEVATERGFRPSTGVGPNYMGGHAFHFDVASGLVIRPDGQMVGQANWTDA